MKSHRFFSKMIPALTIFALVGCASEPRAVLLPLQYPDGTAVVSKGGQPVMAGYQTYGSSVHANATALYQRAAAANCISCANLGAVVSEPSVLRQATGLLGATTIGAGAVMGGVGAMEYGDAAQAGKLQDNINSNYTSQNNSNLSSRSNSSSASAAASSASNQNSLQQHGGNYGGGYQQQGWGGQQGDGQHYAQNDHGWGGSGNGGQY